MNNEIKWETGDNNGMPMSLHEKGLDFKGASAFFFYVSGLIAMSSMIWVVILSLKMLQYSRTQPDLPTYYVPIAVVCIFLSLFFIKTFYTLFNNRRKYRRDIIIAEGVVEYKETSHTGIVEWKEKVKKFEEVGLRHYTYRGVDSWFIALVHSDKTKSIPLFAPDYSNKSASEKDKRELLAKYGTLMGMITTYQEKSAEIGKKE